MCCMAKKKAVSSPSLCPTSQDVGLTLISQTQVKKSTYWFEDHSRRKFYNALGTLLQTAVGPWKELHVMTALEHHTEIELRLAALLSDCNPKKEIHRLTTQWRRRLINHQWLLWGCVHLLICMKVWPIAAASAVGSQFLCVCVCAPEGKCSTVIRCFCVQITALGLSVRS